MSRIKTLLILVCIFFVGCEDRTQKTEDAVKKALLPGTSAAEVESYLKKMNCGFSYDKNTGKYTAVMRNVGPSVFSSKRLLIVIKMDENGKLKNSDFLVYYRNM